MKYYLSILFLCCVSVFCSAQTEDICDKLKYVNVLIQNKQYEEGQNILKTIDESDSLLMTNDSLKYCYFYNYGVILDNFSDLIEEKIEYIKTAIYLQEHFLSMYDSRYLELLWILGRTYREQTDTILAIQTFEKLLIKGKCLQEKKIPKIEKWNGLAYSILADLYVDMAFLYPVEDMYKKSYQFLYSTYNVNHDKLIGPWIPLISLGYYYSLGHEFDKAQSTYSKVFEYIQMGAQVDSIHLLYNQMYTCMMAKDTVNVISIIRELIPLIQIPKNIKQRDICDIYYQALGIYSQKYGRKEIDSLLYVAKEYFNQVEFYRGYIVCMERVVQNFIDRDLFVDVEPLVEEWIRYIHIELGDSSSLMLYALNSLILIKMSNLKLKECGAIFLKADNIAEQINAKNTALYATVLHNWGKYNMMIENYQEAYVKLKKSKELQLEITGEVTSKTEEYLEEIHLYLNK